MFLLIIFLSIAVSIIEERERWRRDSGIGYAPKDIPDKPGNIRLHGVTKATQTNIHFNLIYKSTEVCQLRILCYNINNMSNNSNLAEEKCPRQEGNVIFRGKDLRQMSTETRKLLANERYHFIFAAFGVVQSLVPVKLCFTCKNSPISIGIFL